MNLAELFKQIQDHSQISVTENAVFVKRPDGGVDEYVITGQGTDTEELRLIRSDQELRQDIKALKARLGIA